MEAAHGWTQEDIRRRTEATADQEKAELFPEPEAGAGNGHNHQEDPEPIPAAVVLARLRDQEDGDGRLFVDLHRGRFIFDHAAGTWFKWTGHFWTEDSLNEVMVGIEAVISVYGHQAEKEAWLRLQAERSGDKAKAKLHAGNEDGLMKRVRDLQRLNRKRNVLELAKIGKNGLGISGEEWDRNAWLLGCKNGVLELKTGAFRPGRPEDFIKTPAPVEWKGKDAPAPTWNRFLSEVFEDAGEMVDFLQRVLGYGLIGETFLHILVIFWGRGRNGKTTIFEVLKYVLGRLAHKTRIETLLDQRYQRGSGAPDADTLELRGKRFVWGTEPKAGDAWNIGKLKELVGGDTQNARAPFGKRPVEFTPTYLLLVGTNDKPGAPSAGFAFWERIILVEFPLSFVAIPKQKNERQADPHLLDALKAEASGVLSWLVRGTLEFQRQGLNKPERVRAATEQYQREEDLIQLFIDEKCVLGTKYQVKAGDLFKAYQIWAGEMGLKPMSGIKFGNEIKIRFDHYKTNFRFYIGIALLEGLEV
jgi:putative DNA primase/helicase